MCVMLRVCTSFDAMIDLHEKTDFGMRPDPNEDLFGQDLSTLAFGDFWSLDLASLAWTPSDSDALRVDGAVPGPRMGHGFVAVSDEVLYLHGGVNAPLQACDQSQCRDPGNACRASAPFALPKCADTPEL